MKKISQIVSSILFSSIVIKSFFMQVSVVDATILISCALIFSMYEFLTEKQVKIEFEEFKKLNNTKLEQLQKDLSDTKNYMSKFSAGQAMRK